MLPRVLPKGFTSSDSFVKGSQIMREVSILPDGLTDTVVISIVTRLPAGLRNSDSIPNNGKRIPLPLHASRLALYPAQPSIQSVQRLVRRDNAFWA